MKALELRIKFGMVTRCKINLQKTIPLFFLFWTMLGSICNLHSLTRHQTLQWKRSLSHWTAREVCNCISIYNEQKDTRI